MHEFELGSDLLHNIEKRTKIYRDVLKEADGIAHDVVYDEVMKRANADPRWVHVADFIDTWDENDRMWIGVRSPQMISEAHAAEYGTDEYPPSPIMRTLDDAARLASARSKEHINAKFGAS